MPKGEPLSNFSQISTDRRTVNKVLPFATVGLGIVGVGTLAWAGLGIHSTPLYDPTLTPKPSSSSLDIAQYGQTQPELATGPESVAAKLQLIEAEVGASSLTDEQIAQITLRVGDLYKERFVANLTQPSVDELVSEARIYPGFRGEATANGWPSAYAGPDAAIYVAGKLTIYSDSVNNSPLWYDTEERTPLREFRDLKEDPSTCDRPTPFTILTTSVLKELIRFQAEGGTPVSLSPDLVDAFAKVSPEYGGLPFAEASQIDAHGFSLQIFEKGVDMDNLRTFRFTSMHELAASYFAARLLIDSGLGYAGDQLVFPDKLLAFRNDLATMAGITEDVRLYSMYANSRLEKILRTWADRRLPGEHAEQKDREALRLVFAYEHGREQLLFDQTELACSFRLTPASQ